MQFVKCKLISYAKKQTFYSELLIITLASIRNEYFNMRTFLFARNVRRSWFWVPEAGC